MNRFFSIFMMALGAFLSLNAAEVTFDFATAEGIQAMGYAVPEPSSGTSLTMAGPKTVDGVTLSATDGATGTRIWNSQGSYTLRIYVDGSITLQVAEGSITGITVNAANVNNFDLIADVGDYSADGTVGTWTGSAAAVTLTHVGTKNAQVASIVVTTDAEDPVNPDPDDPIDPNIEKLDSLHHLAALEDGTAFQFTSDVYVNYQWNELRYVMQLDEEGWENYKVYFDGIALSEIDQKGNFTMTSNETDEDGNAIVATMAGFNKFGIDYPEVDPTELYSVEGMMTIYNGIMELYPISITNDPGLRLWKAVYECEDGTQCKISDTLFVAAAVDAGDRKLVFVTDPALDYKKLAQDAKTVHDITLTLSKILEGMPADCNSCNLKPICDEVEGMKELHFGQNKAEFRS